MNSSWAFLLLCHVLATVTHAFDIASLLTEAPSCGLKCVTDGIAHASCDVLADPTCVCQDTNLIDSLQDCVAFSCNGTDALKFSRIQSELCNLPVRDRRSVLKALLAVELVTTFCMCLRIYCRWKISPRHEIEDWLMFGIFIVFLIFTIMGQYFTVTIRAMGLDIWMVEPDDLTTMLKLFYIDESFYLILLTLIKMAMLFFYLRVFPSEKMRIACFIVMGWVVISSIIFVFLQIFQCTPIKYNWEGWMDQTVEHTCVNVNALFRTSAAMFTVQDFVILAIPLPVLLRLHASWRRKAGIIFMFSLGIFVCITSIVRMKFIVEFAKSTNPTWDNTDTVIWSALETNVAVIVLCIPSIRLLLAQWAPHIFGTTQRSKSSTYTPQKPKPHRWLQDTSMPTGQDSRGRLEHDKSANRIRSNPFPGRIFSLKNWGNKVERGTNERGVSLELGDRIRGYTQTEIGVDEELGGTGTSGASSGRGRVSEEDLIAESAERRQSGVESLGDRVIHVRTTTRMHVVSSEDLRWTELPRSAGPSGDSPSLPHVPDLTHQRQD